jgi:hypothetical protein
MFRGKRRPDRVTELHLRVGSANFTAVLEAVEAGYSPLGGAFDDIDTEAAELLIDAFAVQWFICSAAAGNEIAQPENPAAYYPDFWSGKEPATRPRFAGSAGLRSDSTSESDAGFREILDLIATFQV